MCFQIRPRLSTRLLFLCLPLDGTVGLESRRDRYRPTSRPLAVALCSLVV